VQARNTLLKHAFLISLMALLGASPGFAQERIYRCGKNEYTNDQAEAKAKNCKPIDGGNITIVQGTKAQPAKGASPAKAAAAPAASGSAGQRVDANDQRARDADARAVLESELKRSEARLAELRAEYKDGQPDQQGGEARNHQKYLDRVADLKASMARTESDISGIKRELGRLPGAVASGAK
jgi:hypothetical protein